MTVTTATNHNLTVGIAATLRDFTFNCDSGGGASNGTFPPAPGDNNGAPVHVFDVICSSSE